MCKFLGLYKFPFSIFNNGCLINILHNSKIYLWLDHWLFQLNLPFDIRANNPIYHRDSSREYNLNDENDSQLLLNLEPAVYFFESILFLRNYQSDKSSYFVGLSISNEASEEHPRKQIEILVYEYKFSQQNASQNPPAIFRELYTKYSLSVLCFNDAYIQGPILPVYTFEISPDSRLYLIAQWSENLIYSYPTDIPITTNKMEPYLLCLNINNSSVNYSTTSVPSLLWYSKLPEWIEYTVNCTCLSIDNSIVNIFLPYNSDLNSIHHFKIHKKDDKTSQILNKLQSFHNPFSNESRVNWIKFVRTSNINLLMLFQNLSNGGLRLILYNTQPGGIEGSENTPPVYAFTMRFPEYSSNVLNNILVDFYGRWFLCIDENSYGFLYSFEIDWLKDTHAACSNHSSEECSFINSILNFLVDLFSSTLKKTKLSILNKSIQSLFSNQKPSMKNIGTNVTEESLHQKTLPISHHTVLLTLYDHWLSMEQKAMQNNRFCITRRELYKRIAFTLGKWIRLYENPELQISGTSVCGSDSGYAASESIATDVNNDASSLAHSNDIDLLDVSTKGLLEGIPRLTDRCDCYFGRHGIADHEFSELNSVASLPNGLIAVADGNGEKIKFFTPFGQYLYSWDIKTTRARNAFPTYIAVYHNTKNADQKQYQTIQKPFELHQTTSDNNNNNLRSKMNDNLDFSPANVEWNTTDELNSGLVVVLRKPTPGIQIYSLTGVYLREFGIDLISPRCVITDCDGRIIIVESHIMRVSIYTWTGDLLTRFYILLAFPLSVAVDSMHRIYIADNLSHCIAVYNYAGESLGSIGACGLTNFPVGAIILSNPTSNEEQSQELLVVVDNHNNLNITVFNTDGHLIYAMHSNIQHTRICSITVDNQTLLNCMSPNCCNILPMIKNDKQINQTHSHIMSTNNSLQLTTSYSVIIASKDYRIYRYFLPSDIFI
ncbi:unnamed protein product [Heterobilharzia americana]|nr:unnamed protein product [Heterobilharzia americana]